MVVGCVGYTFLLWFCLFYSPSEEWGVIEIHEGDSCGTHTGFRVSSSCERLWAWRHYICSRCPRRMGPGCLYTSVKKKTDISTVRWLLLWRETSSRSIGCKQPSGSALVNIIVSKYIASVSGSSHCCSCRTLFLTLEETTDSSPVLAHRTREDLLQSELVSSPLWRPKTRR